MAMCQSRASTRSPWLGPRLRRSKIRHSEPGTSRIKIWIKTKKISCGSFPCWSVSELSSEKDSGTSGLSGFLALCLQLEVTVASPRKVSSSARALPMEAI
ncbi:hypothetical protein LY78DRAFT_158502 [Colletotrichum sublineola]|nr:hypothetical protein LY78DRAFT_158502 [Colletotrichum sublineola]